MKEICNTCGMDLDGKVEYELLDGSKRGRCSRCYRAYVISEPEDPPETEPPEDPPETEPPEDPPETEPPETEPPETEPPETEPPETEPPETEPEVEPVEE